MAVATGAPPPRGRRHHQRRIRERLDRLDQGRHLQRDNFRGTAHGLQSHLVVRKRDIAAGRAQRVVFKLDFDDDQVTRPRLGAGVDTDRVANV